MYPYIILAVKISHKIHLNFVGSNWVRTACLKQRYRTEKIAKIKLRQCNNIESSNHLEVNRNASWSGNYLFCNHLAAVNCSKLHGSLLHSSSSSKIHALKEPAITSWVKDQHADMKFTSWLHGLVWLLDGPEEPYELIPRQPVHSQNDGGIQACTHLPHQ